MIKDSTEYKFLEEYHRTVGKLKNKIKTITLSPKYVPNSPSHIIEWCKYPDIDKSPARFRNVAAVSTYTAINRGRSSRGALK